MVFILSALWWIRIRVLWKLRRDWLWGNLGLALIDGAMLSKSLIQFSVGWIKSTGGYVLSLKFCLRPNYGGSNGNNGCLFQKNLCQDAPWLPGLLYSVPLIPQPGTVDPRLCWRLLDAHRQIWLSLLWGHCSFLLGPSAHKVLFVPSKHLFPQSCGSSVIKSHWPSKSNSLGVFSPFAGSPGWGMCCGS